MKAYELIRVKDNKTIFQAAYAKHIMDGAFCILMEEYPSTDTRVLLARKVDENERDYGYLLYKLVSHGMRGTKIIGHYVGMGEVRSEEQALERVKANLIGMETLANVMSGERR